MAMMAGARAIEIQYDPADIAAAQQLLAAVPRGWERVASRALNKAASWVRTRVVRAVAEASPLRQKDVRQYVRLLRASLRFLQARVLVLDKGVPVIRLNARQKRSGVKYGSGGNAREIKGAFIATMPAGHRGVFLRRRQLTGQKSHRGKNQAELPIMERYEQSAARVAETRGLVGQLEREGAARLHLELMRQVDVLLAQHAGKLARGGARAAA